VRSGKACHGGCRFAQEPDIRRGVVAYLAGQLAEIMRTEETRRCCAFAIELLPPLDASEPEVPVVPVAEVEPVVPLLVDPCVVSSVPVTST